MRQAGHHMFKSQLSRGELAGLSHKNLECFPADEFLPKFFR